MGFAARLTKVRDADASIAERVAALCVALTSCHAGFHRGKAELRERFGWEIGAPVTHEELIAMADYLKEQWALRQGRSKDG